MHLISSIWMSFLSKPSNRHELHSLELSMAGEPSIISHSWRPYKVQPPDFVFLSENLVNSDTISAISAKLGFTHFFVVDKIGRSGGLAVTWKSTMNCVVMDSSSNHINVLMLEQVGQN